jgi:hypothetical protein
MKDNVVLDLLEGSFRQLKLSFYEIILDAFLLIASIINQKTDAIQLHESNRILTN